MRSNKSIIYLNYINYLKTFYEFISFNHLQLLSFSEDNFIKEKSE